MLHFLKTRRDTEREDRCLGRPNFRTKEQDRGKKFRESIGERARGLRLRFLADEKFRSDTKHDFKGNRGTRSSSLANRELTNEGITVGRFETVDAGKTA